MLLYRSRLLILIPPLALRSCSTGGWGVPKPCSVVFVLATETPQYIRRLQNGRCGPDRSSGLRLQSS